MKYNETLMNEVSSHELETVEGGFIFFLAGAVLGGVIVYVVMSNKVFEGGSSDFLRDASRMG